MTGDFKILVYLYFYSYRVLGWVPFRLSFDLL